MLVSLVDMKAYLGEATTTYDAFLTRQLNLMTSVIQNYCRRIFEVDDYVETLYRQDVPQSERLMLYNYPVNSIASIVYDTTNTLSPSEYRLNKSGGFLLPTGINPFSWSDVMVITYNAGYTTIPPEIEEVMYSIVGQRYNKNKAGVDLNFGSDVQRISVPGTLSIDFDYSLQNNERKSAFGVLLGEYINVLDFFRSERTLVGQSRLEFVEEL